MLIFGQQAVLIPTNWFKPYDVKTYEVRHEYRPIYGSFLDNEPLFFYWASSNPLIRIYPSPIWGRVEANFGFLTCRAEGISFSWRFLGIPSKVHTYLYKGSVIRDDERHPPFKLNFTLAGPLCRLP